MFSWVRLSDIAEWCQAKAPVSSHNIPIASLSTDSRNVEPGEIFLALRGETFDGNLFVEQAVQRGAVAVIANCPMALSVPVLVVTDGLRALISIAENLRARFTGRVIAVTGSAGKSSTKEMIAKLLGPHTLASPASFNNLLGVSKTLCLLQDSTENLVLEMGMNAKGEIAELCRHFKPHMGLITNIGDAHLGKLGGKRGIYEAKKELFDYLASFDLQTSQPAGIALNTDDPLVMEAFQAAFLAPIRTETYSANGESSDAKVRVTHQEIDAQSGWLSLTIAVEGEMLRHKFPIYGLHHTQNIAAAIAAARLMGVGISEITSRLSGIEPASHRGEMKELQDGMTLIDESYNSNPSALLSSLESLCELEVGRRRVLVIGEMREMGDFSEAVHRKVGKALVTLHQKVSFPFVLVGVGTATKPLIEEVKGALPAVDCYSLNDQAEVLPLILPWLKKRDVLFFKGSHGVRLDIVVDKLIGSTV